MKHSPGEPATFRAWISKYALTKGVFEIEAEEPEGSPIIYDVNNRYFTVYGEDRGWHRTPGAALGRAEEMRVAKLKSLDKQLKKLRTMTFKVRPLDQDKK